MKHQRHLAAGLAATLTLAFTTSVAICAGTRAVKAQTTASPHVSLKEPGSVGAESGRVKSRV